MAERKKEPGDAAQDDDLWARRIAYYGLDVKDAHREPVVVAEGECIRLAPRANGDGRFDHRLKQVPVARLSDLKRLIGTPDEAVRTHGGCRCPDLPSESVPPSFKSIDELDGYQHRALYAASRAYLYGDSALVAHHVPALEHAYTLDRRRAIGVLLLQDLIVERGSTVILGGNLHVALFRHIVIRDTGRLRIEKSLKIDCVSIRGEGLIPAQIFDHGTFATAVASAVRA